MATKSEWPNLELAVRDIKRKLTQLELEADELSDVFDDMEFEESPYRPLLFDIETSWAVGFIRGAAEATDQTVCQLLDTFGYR